MKKPSASSTTEVEPDRDDLPEGWSKVPLPEVVYFQEGPGLRKWQFGNVGVPFLNIRTFDNGGIDKSKCQFVKQEEFEGRYEHFLLDEGDLVVSSSGTLGKIATIHASDLPLMLNTSTIRFRALNPESLTQAFLRLYLQSDHFFRQIDSAKTGSAILNYGPSHLKQMLMVLAPPPEQARIVNTAESLVPRVTAARDRLAKVPKILKAFRQSILAAACSGRLTEDWREKHLGTESATRLLERILVARREASSRARYREPEGPESGLDFDVPSIWAVASFDYVTSLVTKGSSPGWQGFEYCDDGVLFVRSQNVRWGSVDLTDRVYLEPRFNKDHPNSIIHSGDVLLNLVGASVGRAAMAPAEVDGANCNQAVGIIRPVPGGIMNYWVLLYLRSPMAQGYITKNKVDVARANFNLDDIKAMALPIPSLPEQQEIVRRVDALFKLADKIEERVAAATKRADKLIQAILAKAFRGELVPKEADLARQEGRTYEPASALLARIRAERETAVASGNGTRRQVNRRKK